MSIDNNPEGTAEVVQDGTVAAAAAAISGILDSDEGTTSENAKPDAGDDAEDVEAQEEQPETDSDGEEAEAAESETETEEDAEAEPKPTPEKYKVKVQGQELEVNLTELIQGYQRQSDYTREKQAVAQEKQAMERALAAERQKLLEKHAQLDAMAQPAEPDWDALMEEDPIGAQRLYIQWDQHQKAQQRRQAEHQQLLEQQRVEDQKRQQEFMNQQAQALLEMKPEWRDKEVAKKESAAIKGFLSEVGYSQEEISRLADPRAVTIAEDAMKYRALMAKKSAVDKKVAKAPKVQKPGVSKNADHAKGEQVKVAKDRLRRTGSLRDAAAVIASLESE